MAMTQHDLSKNVGSRYSFGLDTPAMVAALRQFADDLEAGDVLVSSAVVYRKTDVDDFPTSAMVLKFYENLDDMSPRVREVKNLYSPEHQFPVDTKVAGE